MLIRDLEQRTGLDRATIRYYEKEGLIVPERKENGYRVYSEEIADDLSKIKLLRQLGVGLEKIKSIQQGNEDLMSVVLQQLTQLEGKITSYQQAKLVCKQLCEDRAEYATMDAAHYLTLLNQPAANTALALPKTYRESVPKPFHPWRRFFARYLDFQLLYVLIRFLLIVVLRIRPFTFPNAILVYICTILMIPLEAMFIHLFGTTPGKWVMGIRVESIDGGRHDFITALRRAYWVYHRGCGWYLPLWELWRNYRSYKAYQNGETLDWDVESEITFTPWTWPEKALTVVTAVLIICLHLWTYQDMVLPTHRDTLLTMEQFVENYKDIEEILEINSSYKLDDSGKWQGSTDDYDGNVVIIGGERGRPDYVYQMEQGKITGITFEEKTSDPNLYSVIPMHCQVLAYTAAASQNNVTVQDIITMLQEIDNSTNGSISTGDDTKMINGSAVCGNVTVSWEVVTKNCGISTNNIIFQSDEDTEATYQITFHVEINQ